MSLELTVTVRNHNDSPELAVIELRKDGTWIDDIAVYKHRLGAPEVVAAIDDWLSGRDERTQ